ncbi:MAG TPA: hypothetical protein VFQ83_01455 [Candidatus Udaeobacter sp.]|nr:hypothetical protein [Candidatus Udaeobacter sp.]
MKKKVLELRRKRPGVCPVSDTAFRTLAADPERGVLHYIRCHEAAMLLIDAIRWK